MMGNYVKINTQGPDVKINFFFFKIGNLHLVGLEPTTSPSILLLQGEEVPFQLELIGIDIKINY
jgi:hypothetical protein